MKIESLERAVVLNKKHKVALEMLKQTEWMEGMATKQDAEVATSADQERITNTIKYSIGAVITTTDLSFDQVNRILKLVSKFVREQVGKIEDEIGMI